VRCWAPLRRASLGLAPVCGAGQALGDAILFWFDVERGPTDAGGTRSLCTLRGIAEHTL